MMQSYVSCYVPSCFAVYFVEYNVSNLKWRTATFVLHTVIFHVQART